MLVDKRSKEQMPKAANTTALGWESNCRTPFMLKKGFSQLHTSVPHFTINITFSPPYGAHDGPITIKAESAFFSSLTHTGV